MKSKLRKIKINSNSFVYTFKEELSKNDLTDDLMWINTIRIFREGYKNTPVVVTMHCKDDYYMGNPLTKEIIPELNIHRPAIIRQIIDYAIAQNWDWNKSKFKIKNGMELLTQMGFDISSIEVKKT